MLLSLGSNLGERAAMLLFAKNRLEEELGTSANASSVMETQGFGVSGHPPYLNQVLSFQTALQADEIFLITAKIEREAGRSGKGLMLPRPLDIDIIGLGEIQMNRQDLEIPHKSMHQRFFVLEPLCEIHPDWEHPVLNKSAFQLLSDLKKGYL